MAVKISTDVIEKIKNELPFKTSCMFLKLSDNEKEIILDKEFGAKELPYEKMLKEIPEDECRFILYDHEVSLADRKIWKVILINWSPPNERMRRRMIYSAVKDDVREALPGVALYFDANILSDLDKQSIDDRIKQKAL